MTREGHDTALDRLPEVPNSVWWFLAGASTGVLVFILMLALFAGGSIYAETGGVTF